MGTQIDQGDFRLFAIGDAGAGVQGDRIPDLFGFCLRIAVGQEKTTGGIGAIDLKALVGGKLGRQPQIVQQCREVCLLYTSDAADE